MPPMPPDMLFFLERIVPLVFVAAWGACVGSLTNVLAYRLPLGMSVVLPASRCPSCETRLTWRENIPVFGWLLLRGKCRFCKSRISPEYPIVEAVVAAIFVLFVALWFTIPNPYSKGPVWLGIDWKLLQPEWASNGLMLMWPHMLLVLILVSCLIAMTIIDAKTYTIPLILPWVASIAGVVINPALALYVQLAKGHLEKTAPGYPWTIPTVGYPMLGAAIGGVLGLGVALLMMKVGLIRRSFADYEEWEKSALEKAEAERKATGVPEPASAGPGDDPTHMWIAYPYARREMVRELAFLAPAAVLAYLGWLLFDRIWPTPQLPT
jgi:leader peptidase (prepilin peptidase) / N-methyltransferase